MSPERRWRRGWRDGRARRSRAAGTLGALAGALVVLGAAAAVPVLVAPAGADFSFSEEEARSREEAERARAARQPRALGAACRDRIARRRTVVVVGERVDGGGLRTTQSAYGPHLDGLARALRGLGVRTYSQEQIRQQIAQAEIDAYFNNDPDAALAASRKLGADLVLRGIISSRSAYNPLMGLPEVAVSIALALADGSGRVVSEATASADSYSGADTLGMAQRLVDEQAPAVVGRLFGDYCGAASR